MKHYLVEATRLTRKTNATNTDCPNASEQTIMSASTIKKFKSVANVSLLKTNHGFNGYDTVKLYDYLFNYKEEAIK